MNPSKTAIPTQRSCPAYQATHPADQVWDVVVDVIYAITRAEITDEHVFLWNLERPIDGFKNIQPHACIYLDSDKLLATIDSFSSLKCNLIQAFNIYKNVNSINVIIVNMNVIIL